jgi:hypothetical protein
MNYPIFPFFNVQKMFTFFFLVYIWSSLSIDLFLLFLSQINGRCPYTSYRYRIIYHIGWKFWQSRKTYVNSTKVPLQERPIPNETSPKWPVLFPKLRHYVESDAQPHILSKQRFVPSSPYVFILVCSCHHSHKHFYQIIVIYSPSLLE